MNLLVELLTAVLFCACWLAFGAQSAWLAVIYSVFLAGLIAATFIDAEHEIIPDEITGGGIVVGFICSCLLPRLHRQSSVTGALWESGLGIAAGAGNRRSTHRQSARAPRESLIIRKQGGQVLGSLLFSFTATPRPP